MKPCYLFVLLYAVHIGWVQAEIYKHVDADGHVTYSSTPVKGAKRLDLEPLPTMQPPARTRNDASPSSFPKVDTNTQKSRDDARRKILADELATEEKLLAEARKNLKEGEEKPEVFRQTVVVGKKPDGTPITETVTRRNVARYEEKIKSLQEQVTLHEKNIESLKSELSNLK